MRYLVSILAWLVMVSSVLRLRKQLRRSSKVSGWSLTELSVHSRSTRCTHRPTGHRPLGTVYICIPSRKSLIARTLLSEPRLCITLSTPTVGLTLPPLCRVTSRPGIVTALDLTPGSKGTTVTSWMVCPTCWTPGTVTLIPTPRLRRLSARVSSSLLSLSKMLSRATCSLARAIGRGTVSVLLATREPSRRLVTLNGTASPRSTWFIARPATTSERVTITNPPFGRPRASFGSPTRSGT